MKKVSVLLITILILTGIFFMLNKNNNEIKLDNVEVKENKNVTFAMYKENSSGEYEETEEFPDNTYQLDEEKSICIDSDGEILNEALTYDETNKIISFDTSKTVKCYIYFSYNIIDIIVGSYDSRSSRTIDIKPYTNKYQTLTIDDFYIKNLNQNYVKSSGGESYSNIISSYDASTGMLSLARTYSYSGDWFFFLNYDIHILLNANKTGKVIDLGTYNSNGGRTINVSTYVDDCSKLTKDNFYIKNAKQQYQRASSPNNLSNIISSYNSDTCNLSLAQSSSWANNSEGNKTWAFYSQYSIYVVDAPIIYK